MDVEYLSNYTRDYKVTLEFLNDRKNIKNIWEMTKKIKSKMIVLYWRLSCAKMHSKHQ
jgi:ribulose bisphosphate carboxylase small subunit